MSKKSFDDILKESKQQGVDREIQEYIESLEESNEELSAQNKKLENENEKLLNGGSPSILQKFKSSNKNLRNRNKKLNAEMEKLKRKQSSRLAHLDEKQLGVHQRMLDDFNGMERNTHISFPGVDHPIFSRFIELANKYPNRKFLVSGLTDAINEKLKLIDFEISTQKKNINIWLECDELVAKFPDTWEEEAGDNMAYLYKVTTVDEINKKIDKLKKDKEEVKEWHKLKDTIKTTNDSIEIAEYDNNLYYEVLDEFERIFNFCNYVSGITKYKANIRVDGFNKADMYSALTRELEKQVGLCEEPNTHTFYYSNGEGRLIPYELNRQFLQYVNKNTLFVKLGKTKQYKKGDIINSKALFEEIPLYCNKVQYRNPNLVGFNNCFYDVINSNIVKLNAQAPILPLKNTKTELYLDADIENNPMQHIFDSCFSEKDKKTLLAYIGCALYDKGYTQRQESLFIMGKGGTGKTTLTKAICEIFYSVGHQLVTKLSDNNQFGFSMFADSDVVVIDEIQAAKKEFVDKLKEISGGGALPVEKKHFDTISVPAENVPRIFFIGNNFSHKFFEASDNAGVKRRILIIKPTMPIQDLGYQWRDLISDSCKQWLVQQATQEYIEQGLHEHMLPIKTIDDNEKNERLFLCTFPEQFFIKKHFKVIYEEGSNRVDKDIWLKYRDFHQFIYNCINDEMVESTVKLGVAQTFIKNVKDTFNLGETYKTKQLEGEVYFRGIIPESDEAKKYFKISEKDGKTYYLHGDD